MSGMAAASADGVMIALSEGAGMQLLNKEENLPEKHQLLIRFEDDSSLIATMRMYAGIYVFPKGAFNNPYYLAARDKQSPLEEDFDREYFSFLMPLEGNEKLSVKAFLATEQRIPGLGNGMLQDFLYHAKIYPKRKMNTLSANERKALFSLIKTTLREMADEGGRDT